MRVIIFIILTFFSTMCVATPIPGTELYSAPAMSQVSFSPDSRFIAAVTVFDGKRNLSLIGTNDDFYQDILAIDSKYQLQEYLWIDSSTIYLDYTVKGVIRKALLNLSEKEGKVSSEFIALPSSGYIVDPLADDPNHILYAKDLYDHKPSNRLYKMSLQQLIDGKFTKNVLIDKKLKNVASYTYDSQRKALFALTIDLDNLTGEVRYRPMGERRWQLLIELNDTDSSLSPIGFLNDDTLAVLSNKNSDKIALYEFDIQSQTLGKILYEHAKYDLVDADLTEDGTMVAAVRYIENGHSVSQFFDTGLSEVNSLLNESFKGKNTIFTNHSNDLRYSIVFSYASDDPGAYYLYKQQTNVAELLTELYPNLVDYHLSTTEVLNINSVEEIELEAFLTLPSKENSNSVLLVMPHGGPVGVRDFNYFNPEVQFFTSRGFAVLRVNFRGSDGYGKQFLDSGKGEFGKAIEQDITAAVAKVQQTHKFKRMCAIGASYGGYSSLMLAIKHPKDYACAVGGYGIYDLPLLFNGNNIKVSEDFRESVTEVVGQLSEGLIEYSPVYLADKIQVPVLLIAGRNDRIADFEHTKRMEYVLNQFDKDVETLYYKNTGHGQTSWYWQRHEAAYIADYLQRTLGLDDYHNKASVDAELVKKLAVDVALLADGFQFDNKVTNDEILANKLYRKAAEMGEGRSAYNLAKRLINKGESLKGKSAIFSSDIELNDADVQPEFDLGNHSNQEADELFEDGVEWARKSSLLGYSNAGYWLGIEYELGNIVEKNWQKSLEFYEIAKDAGHDAQSIVRAGRVYCLASAPLRDIARCSELLSLTNLKQSELNEVTNAVTDKSRETLRWALADIYAKGKFTSEELLLLQEVVKSEYEASPVEVRIEDLEFGEVEYNFRRGYYQVSDDASSFSGAGDLELGATFELEFESESEGEGEGEGESVALIGRWIKQTQGKEDEVIGSVLVWGGQQVEHWVIRHTIENTVDFDSKLVLEIRDLNNSLLTSQSVELH